MPTSRLRYFLLVFQALDLEVTDTWHQRIVLVVPVVYDLTHAASLEDLGTVQARIVSQVRG